MGVAKKRWSDLSQAQRTAIVAAGAAEVVLTTFALIDVVRRPGAQVRGPKAVWLLSFVVQPFGPLAYLALARRPGPPTAAGGITRTG